MQEELQQPDQITQPQTTAASSRLFKFVVPFVVLVFLLAGFLLFRTLTGTKQSTQSLQEQSVSTVDLSTLNELGGTGLSGYEQLVVNGELRINGALIVPDAQPTNSPQSGQIVFNPQTNSLLFYNGTEYVEVVTTQSACLVGATNCGFLTADDIPTVVLPQDLATTATPTFSNLNLSGPLSVSDGGTGATSFTLNGVLYGNGAGGILATSAPAAGQILIGSASGVPVFVTANGDVSISNTGGVQLVSDSVGSNELQSTSVTAGIYGDGTSYPVFTVDSDGRITDVSTQSIGGGGGGVGSLNSLSGALTIAGTANQISVTSSGSTITLSTPQSIATSSSPTFSSLTLTSALGLGSGGTGATTAQGAINAISGLTTNGDLLYNNGINTTRLARGSTNQCLISTATTISWNNCTGLGAVDSMNGLVGALSLANASGSGSTITINDASTSQKGIAQFSSSNFTVSSGSVSIANDAIALGTQTTGNYVATITAGGGLTGNATGEGSTPTIDIGAGNGITVNTNDITLALQANKGLEVDVNGLSLIDCANGEVLKYNGSNQWACAADAGGSGVGDDISVNGSAATNVNFLDTAASSTVASTTWNLNTVSNPDDITLVIGAASGTDAGILTAGTQTLAGAKTFNNQITAGAGISLGSQTLQGTTAVIDFSNFDVSSSGAVTAVGVNAGSGLLQGTGGLTISGTTTLASLTNGFLEVNGSGVVSVGTIDLGTDTAGNYVATISAGNGISGSSATEGGTPTIALANLTADWLQSGAFDITLDNAGSELKILESTGGTYYAVLDTADLSADQTFTLNQGGTVVTSGNVSTYATTGVSAGSGLSGGGTTGSFTIDIGAGNGITVNTNDITLALQANKGLEVDVNGLSLIDCANGEVLKYNGSNQWACAADAGGSGVGDDISVNGSAATNVDFADVAATGTVAGVSWTLNTLTSPDSLTLAISNASATQAGTITTGAQTIAGSKTLSDTLVLQNATSMQLGVASTTTGSARFYNAAGTGYIALQATNPGSSNYTITLPAATGTVCLDTGNCLGGGSGGANTALSNLTGVNINTALNSTGANLALTTTTSGNITLTPASATELVNVLTGNLKVGNGTPDVTLNGEDAYIEGTLEVDGAVSLDGGLTVVGTTDLNTTGSANTSIGNATGSLTLTGSSSSSFVLNGTTVSAAEFNVLDAGIELGDLTTQGTATDEYCLTSETGGGALLAWQDCSSSTTLQTAYNNGNSIETASNTAVVITETTTGSVTGDLLQLTVNQAAGGTFSGDALQITMDGNDANAFTGNGLNIVVDQSQNTGSPILVQDDAAVALFYVQETGSLVINSTSSGNSLTIQDSGTSNLYIDKYGTIYLGSGGNTSIYGYSSGNIDITNAGASNITSILTGNLKVGNGTPGLTLNGEDAYIEGTFEADGVAQLDGGASISGGIDNNSGGITEAGAVSGATTITASSNINTTAGVFQLNGTDINTAGTLSNVAYENQANVFTQANTFQNNLGITNAGYLATQRGSDVSTTGALDDLNFGTSSLVRFTGASTQTLSGLAGGADGRILTIVNAASQALVIVNDATSTAANRIMTGTGGNISVPAGSSLTLIYDSGASRWRVIGDIAAGAGSGVTTVGAIDGGSYSANGASISANTIYLQTASITRVGLVDVGNQTFNGVKTFDDGAVITAGGLTIDAGALAVNSDSITSDGATLTINAGGNVDIQDNLTADFLTSDTGLTVTSGGASITGNSTIATGAGNTLSIGNATGTLTVTGSSSSTFVLNGTTVDATEFNRLDGGITLQESYDAGNTITLTDARDFTVTAADTATDPNITFNLAGAGDFSIQDAGSAVFTINDDGTAIFRTQIDSGTGFQIQDSDGGTPIFSVDTSNERVGIGTASPGSIFQVGEGGVNNRMYFDNVGSSTLTLYSNNENSMLDISSGWGGGDTPYLKIRRGNSSNGINLTVGTISANRILTLPDEDGTVCSTGSVCSGYQASLGYTAANVNLSNITATNLGAALNKTSGDLALQTTTSGNITLTPASSSELVNVLTGNLKVGNGTPGVTLNGEDAYIEGTLEVDGSITLGSDTITDFTGNGLTLSSNVLTLQAAASADALSATTSSGSGLEVLASGLALLQGCSDNQVLQWKEATDLWQCSSAGTGDVVNGGQNGAVTLGTNDSNNLSFETNGTTRWYIDTSGNLLPNTDDTYDIGSSSLRVQDVYVGPSSIHIGSNATDEASISYNTSTNNLTTTTPYGGMYFDVQGTGTQSVTYVRSAGTGASSSTSMDIGTAATNRVVVVYASDDSTGTSLTGVTVGGKQCNFVALEDETTGHIEMWYCDEDDLGSLSGTQTIAATGADASWAVHAHLYTGASQGGPYDSGTGFAATSASVTVTGIDTPANGMVIMGAHESAGSKTIVSWTSPLATILDGPDPTSASLFTANGTETSAQTNKSYTFTFSTSSNDELAIVASWGGADYGARFNLSNQSSFGIQDAGSDVLRVGSDGTTLIQAPTTATQAALRVVGGLNTSTTEGLWTPSLVVDNAAASTQNIIELRVAGTRRGSIRVDSGGNLVLNPGSGGASYLNYDEGSGITIFGDGNQGTAGTFTASSRNLTIGTGSNSGRLTLWGSYFEDTGSGLQIYSGDDEVQINDTLWVTGNIVHAGIPAGGGGSGGVCVNGFAVYETCASLRQLKENIVGLSTGLAEISLFNPVEYNWRNDGIRDIGFIAEDVEAINPMYATYMFGKLTGVNYDHLVALGFKGIQELDVRTQQQQTQIDTLETGQFTSITTTGNATIGGDLSVVGNVTVQNITAVGVMTTRDLSVSGTATVQTLKVDGVAEFAGDIHLLGAVNTRQVTTKLFKASGPMTAGSVVVIDDTKEGYVTTTATPGDTKIVGVLVQDANATGQDVQVAVEGSIQVKFGVGDTVSSGNIVVSSNVSGEAQVSSTPGVGQVLGKTTSQKDANNLAWVLITLQ